MNKEQVQQNKEHKNCGTDECCMECNTAVPVQLELFPELISKEDGWRILTQR